MNPRTLIALSVSVVAVGWAFWIVASPAVRDDTALPTAAITDGIQVIDITAKGGYSPRVVRATAGVPTILRVSTKGTFDCSASLVVPALSYRRFLQPSGVEEIAISAEQAQGTLRGLCSMGMYSFQIIFQ